MKTAALLFLIAVLLSGCAESEAMKAQNLAVQRANVTPFEERPALYARMEKEGLITPATHQDWLADWESQKPGWVQDQKQKEKRQVAEKAESVKRERMLASLTPAQRLDLEMRQKELDAQRERQEAAFAFQAQQAEQQQQQARRQAFANAIGAMGDQIQAQQAQRNAQIDAQIRENTARMSQLPPRNRSYDSTVTPSTYPGGPVQVHTEETGY